jgi:hypothetical protein
LIIIFKSVGSIVKLRFDSHSKTTFNPFRAKFKELLIADMTNGTDNEKANNRFMSELTARLLASDPATCGETQDHESESLITCHCRKSKCLKLYVKCDAPNIINFNSMC